jgi:Rrf2 family protein
MKGLVNLSEGVLIGLHGIIIVARRKPLPTSAKLIAETTGASLNTVAKTMQRLVHARLVDSERGPAGGFTLARSASDITLFDVFAAVEGEPDENPCPFNAESCMMGGCIFGNTIRKLSKELKQFLNGKTVSAFIG